MPTNKRNTRRTTVTVTYRKRKAKETPAAVKRTNNKKKKTKVKAKTNIAKKEEGVFDISKYLSEIGELENTVIISFVLVSPSQVIALNVLLIFFFKSFFKTSFGISASVKM